MMARTNLHQTTLSQVVADSLRASMMDCPGLDRNSRCEIKSLLERCQNMNRSWQIMTDLSYVMYLSISIMCIYIYMYIYIYVCTYIYIYIYMFIRILYWSLSLCVHRPPMHLLIIWGLKTTESKHPQVVEPPLPCKELSRRVLASLARLNEVEEVRWDD